MRRTIALVLLLLGVVLARPAYGVGPVFSGGTPQPPAIGGPSIATGLVIYGGAQVELGAASWMRFTSAQSTGIQIYSGGALRYASGSKPTIAGTSPTNDAVVGGTAKALAAIPYVDTATLAAFVVSQ